jgi:2-iminoacetate synthase ThiH
MSDSKVIKKSLNIWEICPDRCPICGMRRSNPKHPGRKCSAIMKARQQAKVLQQ